MSNNLKVGVLHPGSMGLTIAKAFNASGCEILCATEGRSERTVDRVETANYKDVGTIANMVEQADVIASICDGRGVFAVYQKDRPDEEVHFPVAREVMEAGFKGIYLDCNTIIHDPVESRWEKALEEYVNNNGASYVSAAIYGYPPAQGEKHNKSQHVRFLFVSGEKAQTIVDILDSNDFPLVGEIPPEDAKDYKRRLIEENEPPNPELYSRTDEVWTNAHSD
tara:strand:- start:6333 stop:7001 length:669 start_codon:yes stop_codon:yes gene_type:complete